MSIVNIIAPSFPGLRPSNGPPSSSPSRFSLAYRIVLGIKERKQMAVHVYASSKSFGSSKGRTGLLERPGFDQSQFDPLPQIQEGGDMGWLKDKLGLTSGGSYRVLLIDDACHTENLVEKALPLAVPSVDAYTARRLFHESCKTGVALVIVTVKEHAEFYAQMMVRYGLRACIEPDSSAHGTN